MKKVFLKVNNVKCDLYLPDDEKEVKNILIVCDGIRNKYIRDIVNEMVMDNILENIGVVYFDFFETGKFNNIKEKLILHKCIKKFENIYLFLKEKYPNTKLNVFSVGFSSYVTLVSIKKLNLKFSNVFYYTPEFDMLTIFRTKLKNENLIDFNKLNIRKIKFYRKVEEINDFYKELSENKIDILKNSSVYDSIIFCESKDREKLLNNFKRLNLNISKLNLVECNKEETVNIMIKKIEKSGD